MQEIINLQKKIVPEVVDLLEKRYNILRAIYFNQPIGRRVLASELHLSERIVRTEITFLKGQGLIDINTPGMTVTKEGEELVYKLNAFVHELKGLSDVESEVCNLLKVKKVIIVPGDVDKNPAILSDLGKAASNYLKKMVKDNDTIAITGGTAVKETVESLSKVNNVSRVLVVPARGGMGRTVEVQANTLAALLASKLNGTYKMLHIPENISPELLKSLKEEREVKEVLESVENADIFLYGIGNAIEMAEKRGLSEKSIEKLKSLEAVGEACGCYFNKASKVVAKTTAIGINIFEARGISTHIAVAGGKNKLESIIVTQKGNTNGVLVTDEACAREIVKILSKQNN
ncbi:sugar-binding transcriptional regulator [Clostridium sp. LY3-2]|uniref:sugar-binding transcriptional regulator n=1 Tax=Clostridium sp. LY3-2 TaxID=2942482 RepID=UPI0021530536|nr:sugar-binding domain-containing protein [Clostridium sp. LY3-2]MCR6513966.1 sugar-binding transcriptional regulator [Clostridium sp. LY3-2]